MNTPVVLHAVLMIGILLWYLKNRNLFSWGGIIISLFTLSAICALFIVDELNATRPMEYSLFPTLFFFLAFIIYMRPFLIYDKNITKRIFTQGADYKYLIYVYTFAAVVLTVYLIPRVRGIDFGDLLSAYDMAWESADDHKLYDSAFEGIMINIIFYLRLPMIVIFFYNLSRPCVTKRMKIITALAIFIPNFLWSIRFVSRAQLVMLFMAFFFCYVFFKDTILPKIRKKINVALLSFTSLIVVFFLMITMGRFTENANQALLFYVGHPSLIYNGAVVTPSTGTMGGQIFFGWFYDKLGIKRIGEADENIGTTADSAFKTFVGSRYIDFGPVGTILYGVLLSLILKHLIKRKKVGVAEIYIYLFYTQWIFIGAFYDSVDAVSWIMAFVIYIILKSPLFITKKNGNNCILPAPVPSNAS